MTLNDTMAYATLYNYNYKAIRHHTTPQRYTRLYNNI